MNISKTFLGSIFLVVSTHVFADDEVDFVRINCVPAAKFLAVQFLPVFSGDPGLNNQTDAASKSAQLQGFYRLDNINQECLLSGVRYQIEVHPRPLTNAMCGALSQADITVKMDGRLLLDAIPIGNSCTSRALQSLVITDVPSRKERKVVRYCLKEESSGIEECKAVADMYDDFTKNFPINSAKINKGKPLK